DGRPLSAAADKPSLGFTFAESLADSSTQHRRRQKVGRDCTWWTSECELGRPRHSIRDAYLARSHLPCG
ncbi:MAG: hypothetical protein ACUVTZ_09830, partial [Armatimonadota bacterium]